MSLRTRALMIGLTGPAVQGIGFFWQAAHVLLYHLHEPLSLRHIVFEPGFLVIFVGMLISIVCIPVAIDVATATPDDVAIPVFGSEPRDDRPIESGSPT
jgi:hypothetical protein